MVTYHSSSSCAFICTAVIRYRCLSLRPSPTFGICFHSTLSGPSSGCLPRSGNIHTFAPTTVCLCNWISLALIHLMRTCLSRGLPIPRLSTCCATCLASFSSSLLHSLPNFRPTSTFSAGHAGFFLAQRFRAALILPISVSSWSILSCLLLCAAWMALASSSVYPSVCFVSTP